MPLRALRQDCQQAEAQQADQAGEEHGGMAEGPDQLAHQAGGAGALAASGRYRGPICPQPASSSAAASASMAAGKCMSPAPLR